MVTFSRCKKAELDDLATGKTVAAGVSAGPTGSLMLAVPLPCKVDPGEPVKVRFLEPTLGVITTLCRLTSPLVTNDRRFVIYRCQVLDVLAQNQRREDVKIPLTAQVTVTHDLTDAVAPAVLRNISASGVYLTTILSARPGDCLSFTLRETGIHVPLVAEVLRAELLPKQGGMGYGCRFVKLSPSNEARLRAYVFKEERKLYKQS